MTVPIKHVCVYFCRWIKNPHDKIALCICDKKNFFFWFNSEAAFHGQGQLPISAGEHGAITKDCFLDLSGVKGISETELASAKDRGPISDALSARIIQMLKDPIDTLSEVHKTLALTNLA